MSASHDVVAIGNALVDVIAPAEEPFILGEGLAKGAMTLIDEARAEALYAAMAPGVESSGGSAGNTAVGAASLGARAAYVGKVAADSLGETFAREARAVGVGFDVRPLTGGPATGRCLVNVTPDGERTMCTYLGASVELTPADVDAGLIEGAAIVYLEGYLFDPPEARRAFAKAAGLARAAGRAIALTLSDAFVVERHRGALLQFIETEVDLLFANEAEILSLFQAATFDEAAAAARGMTKIAALTRSAKGSVVLAGDGCWSVEAAPVAKVVDTTGAGDQYAAGFMTGLARGLQFKACAELGSLAAAEVISHFGPKPLTSLAALAAERGLL